MNKFEKERQLRFEENFKKGEWSKAFCLYDGKKGSISFRVTMHNGTEVKSGNWHDTYDEDGNWVIPYTKPRMEKDVTDKKIRNKYK
jgi:hypothetical protein